MCLPIARVFAGYRDIRMQERCVEIGIRLPRGAPGALHKPKLGIQFDRRGVIVADMQPDVPYFFIMRVFNGAFGKGACNSMTAIVRVNRDIGDQINALIFISKWDQARVADDPSVLLPDITRQRQGSGLGGAVRPLVVPPKGFSPRVVLR